VISEDIYNNIPGEILSEKRIRVGHGLSYETGVKKHMDLGDGLTKDPIHAECLVGDGLALQVLPLEVAVEIHRHPEFPERIAGQKGLHLLHTEPDPRGIIQIFLQGHKKMIE
jgi:hypothetical protein